MTEVRRRLKTLVGIYGQDFQELKLVITVKGKYNNILKSKSKDELSLT